MIKYTTVDAIFAKLNRDIKGTNLNESDVVEWIGEVIEYLKIPQTLKEEVIFLDVFDYQVPIPKQLYRIIQIAKDNEHTPINKCDIVEDTVKEDEKEESITTCRATYTGINTLPGQEDLQYLNWISSERYKTNFSPIRLSSSVFFNSIVCKERDENLYNNCDEEYTVVGEIDKLLRFSFKEGRIALSYLKNVYDEKTGYPLIPDEINVINAIVYYIKWKIAEYLSWSGREGYINLSDRNEKRYLKYLRQALNKMKMPNSLDDYQDLLEQSLYLIPNHKKYYNHFNQANKKEERNFMFSNKRYY